VLMEHLASKGYVVFSIAHTYDAAPVIFPNGDVIELPAPYTNKELEKSYQPSEELIKLAMETGPKFSEGKTYDERYEGFLGEIKLKWLADDRILLESPAVWLADRLFVVDALAKGEAPDTIADLLARSDLTRVGHMGMSFGASTAAATAYADPRCVAAISLDGSDAYHTGINVDIPVPFMMLYSDSMNDWGVVEDSGNRPFGFNDFSYERFATTGLRDDIIRLHVIGSMHYGVSDTQLMMRGPLHNMLAGPIDGNLMIGILNDFVSGFFDKYLRGITNDFPQEQFTEYANDVVPHDVSGVREWWLSKSAEEQAVLEQKLEEALIAPVPK
jgi:predicted dienelactone hydrolase